MPCLTAFYRDRQVGEPLSLRSREGLDTSVHPGESLAGGRVTGVIHCYSSSPELAHRALDLGFYLGIGGMLTFKRAEALRATVREVPLERLLLETDAPYLSPHPHRGKTNEPSRVPLVAGTLADLHGMTAEQMGQLTSANARRAFALPAAAGVA